MDGLGLIVESGSRSRRYSNRPRFWGKLRRYAPILLVVVLPTCVAGIYLFAIAADQYVSEARFVVRGPAQQAPNALSSLLQTAGVSRADDDTFAVQDYIVSRDALTELMQAVDVKAIFTRPEADFLTRFHTSYSRGPFEHLYKYYTKHVGVEMDTGTGVSRLGVVAFRPEDARLIAATLLVGAEKLVNRMNDRQREDTLREARREVQLAEDHVQQLSQVLANFRNKEGMLDPGKQSSTMLAAISALQSRLVSVRIEISGLARNSPLLVSARQRAAALQAQIDQANRQVTGTDASMVPKIRAFDMLSLDRDFAEKQLASATASLEAARVAADRQQLYLEPIVAPDQPDLAEFPHRFKSLAVVFFSLCGIYVMGALLVAGAREHKLV